MPMPLSLSLSLSQFIYKQQCPHPPLTPPHSTRSGAAAKEVSHHDCNSTKPSLAIERERENQPSSTMTEKRCFINSIGYDQIISILELLPLDSLISFSMTCRRFKSISSSERLWEYICRRDWGNSSVDALFDKKPSWKLLYQQVHHLASVSCARLTHTDECSPRPRASHSLNFISDCLVLFGGGCEGGRHLDDTWVAYIGNGVSRVLRWQKLNSGIPTGRFGQTCIVVGNSLVLFGGINDNGIRQNDTWIGHVSHDETLEIKLSWRPLDAGPILPPPRGAHAGCNVGDKRMVIHGGIGLYGLRLNDTWLLDLSEDARSATWHEVVTLPSPPARSGHTLTWIGGTHMILFGGRGVGYEVLNDVWLFDLGGEYPEWVELFDYPSNIRNKVPLPRVGHSATLVLGGRVLIYGGEDSYRHRKDDFWILDPGTLPAVKMRSCMYSKRLSGKMWKRLKVEGDQPDCRSFHRACTDQTGRYVYTCGGMVDGVIQPAETSGLKFDGELYLVELALHL